MNRHSIANAVLALPDDMIHYQHNRIPTVREMARLQTFDDDYVILGKRTSGFMERRVDVPQYTQVGNAVPPLLGRVLGAAVVKLLGGAPHDIRDVEGRRERHAWVRGTSGYSGYTLDPAAEFSLVLYDVQGQRLPLPTSCEDCPVAQAPRLGRWRGHRAAKRRQWTPGVNTLPEVA
jgi:DNA (cytosine-5)-methyltransferase 1